MYIINTKLFIILYKTNIKHFHSTTDRVNNFSTQNLSVADESFLKQKETDLYYSQP